MSLDHHSVPVQVLRGGLMGMNEGLTKWASKAAIRISTARDLGPVELLIVNCYKAYHIWSMGIFWVQTPIKEVEER